MLPSADKNKFHASWLLLSLLGILIGCCPECQAGIPPGRTLCGVDVLVQDGFGPLEGLRLGLITNHTGLTRNGQSTIDVLNGQRNLDLVALFSPEHGIRGDRDVNIDSDRDIATGLPIHSLYGKTRQPTPGMLEGLDAVVFDIQDIGTRYYTYIGTMSLAMQAARKSGIRFIVLDRPNPIGGVAVAGAVPAASECGGITSIHPIPTRHGMTVGELALLFNDHFEIGCDLVVIKMENWNRAMDYEETGFLWIPPSPNMKTLNAAFLYPGLGIGEGTNLSCGRGTDRPFEMYGAPYWNSSGIVKSLSAIDFPGVRFVPFSFTPTAPGHPFVNEKCEGIFAVLFDRAVCDPIRAGLHMIQAVYRAHPDRFTQRSSFSTLAGDPKLWDDLTAGGISPEVILERWRPAVEDFKQLREPYLLYE